MRQRQLIKKVDINLIRTKFHTDEHSYFDIEKDEENTFVFLAKYSFGPVGMYPISSKVRIKVTLTKLEQYVTEIRLQSMMVVRKVYFQVLLICISFMAAVFGHKEDEFSWAILVGVLGAGILMLEGVYRIQQKELENYIILYINELD